jgi:acyl-CoA thioesterase
MGFKEDKTVHEMATRLLENDPASQMLGIRIVQARHDHCEVSMEVTEIMTNGYDVCHGGFIFALADTAVAFACATEGKVAVSASSEIEFLASVKLGCKLIATADVIHHKGRNCFCNMTVRNDMGDLIALIHGRQVVLDKGTLQVK